MTVNSSCLSNPARPCFHLPRPQRRCKKSGVSLDAAFLAAYHTYLYRCTSQTDMLILNAFSNSTDGVEVCCLRLGLKHDDTLSGDEDPE